MNLYRERVEGVLEDSIGVNEGVSDPRSHGPRFQDLGQDLGPHWCPAIWANLAHRIKALLLTQFKSSTTVQLKLSPVPSFAVFPSRAPCCLVYYAFQTALLIQQVNERRLPASVASVVRSRYGDSDGLGLQPEILLLLICASRDQDCVLFIMSIYRLPPLLETGTAFHHL